MFLCWLWLIPAFLLPPQLLSPSPPDSSSESIEPESGKGSTDPVTSDSPSTSPDSPSTDDADHFTLHLAKSDLDFPIGLGASLVSVDLAFARVAQASATQPPSRTRSGQSAAGEDVEVGGGVVGGAVGAMEGAGGISEGVEAVQASGN